MVTTEDILRTMETVKVVTPVANIDVKAPLVAQGLDSLDVSTLMLALESKYNRTIPPEKAARLRTVADIAAFLNT